MNAIMMKKIDREVRKLDPKVVKPSIKLNLQQRKIFNEIVADLINEGPKAIVVKVYRQQIVMDDEGAWIFENALDQAINATR